MEIVEAMDRDLNSNFEYSITSGKKTGPSSKTFFFLF